MPLLPKSEKGFAPIAIVAVVAVVILAGAGYFFMSKSGNAPQIPGAPSLGGLTLNPNCEYNDPDLCKFVNNWKETKDFSAKSAMTSKQGPKVDSLYEMSGKDKVHMVMSEGGKENWNTITIGDTTYTKDFSDNKWWKQTVKKEELKEKLGDDFDFDFSESTEEADKTEYKKEGKEACGNMQCFKYQIVESGSSDTKQYLWFDDREYMMRKMRVEDNEGNITESEFAYTGVNISAPSPTKEAKEGQIIVPGGTSMEIPQMSDEDKKAYDEAMKQGAKMQQDLETSGYQEPEYNPDTSTDYSGSEE